MKNVSCGNCEYFSTRGKYVDGKFIQSTNEEGEKTGWCQHSPPVIDKVWPRISEMESCGQYKKRDTRVNASWKYGYERLENENKKLERKLETAMILHQVIGKLAPLVGKKPSSQRLSILKAIEKSLTQKGSK